MTGHEMVDPANGELRRDDRASRPGMSSGGEDAGSTYVVVWSGATRAALPGIRSEGWTQARNTLLEQAPGSRDWISNRESLQLKAPAADGWNNRPKGWTGARGRPPLTVANRTQTCACGRWKLTTVARCAGCRKGIPKRADKPKVPVVTACVSCGRALSPSQQRARVRTCQKVRCRRGASTRRAA